MKPSFQERRPQRTFRGSVRFVTFLILVALAGWFGGVTLARFSASPKAAPKPVKSAKVNSPFPSLPAPAPAGESETVAGAPQPEPEKKTEEEQMAEKAFEPGPYKKGELVLTAGSAEELNAIISRAQAAGATVAGLIPGLNSVRLAFSDAASMEAFLSSGSGGNAAGGPQIAYNNLVSLPTPPPPPLDPYAPGSLIPFGTGALPFMGVPANNSGWGRGITIAFLDSGVSSTTQSMLRSGSLQQMDMTQSNDPPEPGHGDLVAAVLGGSGGDQGIAPGASLMSIRVLDKNNQGDAFSVAEGIYTAVSQGARIINLSLGTDLPSTVLQQAIDYALGQGAVVVAAAGNDGVGHISFPAAYSGVISVAAVDATGQRASFSNYGPEMGFAAPGVGLNTTTAAGKLWFSGTSAAAPLVSGAIAAVMTMRPNLSASQAADLLRRSANYAGPVTDTGTNQFYGSGIANLSRIVDTSPFRGDLAIADIYVNISAAPTTPTVPTQIVVQNRSNHMVFSAQVDIDYAGSHESQTIAMLNPGEVRAFTVELAVADLTSTSGVTVQARISAPMENDVNPGDNQVARLIRLLPLK